MKKISILIILLPLFLNISAQEENNIHEEEITLQTDTGNLYGTLTLADTNQTTPLVIIIAGSGPTDRNGNNYAGLKTNAYKMLAHDLALHEISSFRFDKRGVAQSKSAAKSEKDLRFETYIQDVKDWIDLLKKDKRFSAIFILGHSEGSLIGMIAIENRRDISGYISIAGAGKPIDKIIHEQLKGKLSPELMAESDKILDSLKAGKTVSNINMMLWSLYRPSVQPYMISWLKYNPQVEIKKILVPVLIIQGTSDTQVSTEDAELLKNAKPDAKLVIIENMNHVLKEVRSPEENTASYKNPEIPLQKKLIEELVNFIQTNIK